MKIMRILIIIILSTVLFVSCTKETVTDPVSDTKGVLEFKCINPMVSLLKNLNSNAKISANPPLVGDTTVTINTSLILTIGDVWVSQGEVRDGGTDNLEWIRLTDVTNTTLKLFEDYSFPAKELPAGDYKSIKVTFKNIWYRQVKLVSDPTVVYELLETMGSSSDPCDPNDTTWIKPNYFAPGGNFSLGEDGKFHLASAGEKVDGFTIKEGKKANVFWRLGAGATEPCINYLIDKNSNRQWDCGIDEVKIECPPSVIYMWDFVVEYE